MKALPIIIILMVLTGCSSSGDGGITGGSTGGDADGGVTDTGSNGTTGPDINDLAVHDTDIYDPNNSVSNACSSTLWDAVAGTYQGTIEASQATAGGSPESECFWDIDVVLKRVYAPNTNRGTCNLETTFTSSFVSNEYAANNVDVCEEMNLSGVIKSEFDEPALSNPTWPMTLIVDLNSEFQQRADLAPLDFPRPQGRNTLSSVEFNVNSSGAMFYRPILYTDSSYAFWSWNVQRTGRDAAP